MKSPTNNTTLNIIIGSFMILSSIRIAIVIHDRFFKPSPTKKCGGCNLSG